MDGSMNKQDPQFVSRALRGWQPQDERCRAVYELVQSGVAWKNAAETIGVDQAVAQKRYRLRGICSPRRSNATPDGGVDAAAKRVYDKVLNGASARSAAEGEGISYESYRVRLARNQNLSPSRMLKEAKVGIGLLPESWTPA